MTELDNVKIYNENCLDLLQNIQKESIQTIYLDPPFNSKRDYQLTVDNCLGFSDKWNDNDYRLFIEKIIDLSIPILKKNGNLYFHISSDCMFIPESILRSKFNYVTPIFWKKCRSKNNVKNKLGSTIDFIFQCTNSKKPKFNIVYQEKDEKYLNNSFKNKDEVGNYSLGHLVTEPSKKGYMYEFTYGDKIFNPDSGWRIKKETLEQLASENRLHFPKTKKGKLYKKIYLHENPGKLCTDLWDDIHSISQGNELRKYPTAKPVKLLERIIEISTDENDLVLDPMCGSGTTGVACKNLNRKCILNDLNSDVINVVKENINL
jgi:site-specific DNA-methyltransferase (adenine-specific)